MKKFIFIVCILLLAVWRVEAVQAAEKLDFYGVIDKEAIKQEVDASTWINMPSKTDVPLLKSWDITFSQEVTFDKLAGAVIEKNNAFIPVKIEFPGNNKLKISPTERYEANTTYTLKLFLHNGKRYKMQFTTTDNLNSLIAPVKVYPDGANAEAQIIRVPAMPEEGFNFPYYIRIPSSYYKNNSNNANEKRYVFMDTANSGPTSQDGTEYWVKDVLKNQGQWSVMLAEKMWAPIIMPATVRSHVCYYSEMGEQNCIDEHSFDRDTAILDQLLSSKIGGTLKKYYAEKDLVATDYLNYDEQLIAMFEHAVKFLNSYGQNVETDKMIVTGYSSGGTFSDRLSMLHPTRIKAVASGATLDDMVMPVATYKEEKLIFPIGIADYEEITGHKFDLKAVNQMAKLVYMGKDDNNVTLPYTDAFGDAERNTIIRAFSADTLKRTYEMMNVYHNAGGEAMFVLDIGIGHSSSDAMVDFALQFLLANRASDKPVYPVPKNTAQLEYKVHN